MERDSLTAAYAAAKRLNDAGKLDDAIALLEPLLPLSTEPLAEEQSDALFLLCSLYHATHQLRKGEKLLDAALALLAPDQDLASFYRLRALFYEARGHRNKAVAEWKKAEEAEEGCSDPILRAYARVLRLQAMNSEQALAATQEALEIVPKDRQVVSQLHLIAADCAFTSGDGDEAWKWASKTVSHRSATASERTRGMQIKGQVALQNGNHLEALERLNEATLLARTGADWLSAGQLALTTARYLLLLGRIADAEALANETSARFPLLTSDVLILLVHAACERGDLTEAEAALELAEAKSKGEPQAGLALASALIASEKGDHDRALSSLEKALAQSHGQTKKLLSYQRLPLLWLAGKKAQAVSGWEQLQGTLSTTASREQQMVYYRAEGRLAYLQESWTGGIAAWKQVLRVQPFPLHLAEDWTQLGDGYAEQGESAAARFAWEKAAAQPVESIWVRRAKDRLEAS